MIFTCNPTARLSISSHQYSGRELEAFALHGGGDHEEGWGWLPEVESRLTWHVTLRICKIERIGQILR
jgi:hypothetical protein